MTRRNERSLSNCSGSSRFVSSHTIIAVVVAFLVGIVPVAAHIVAALTVEAAPDTDIAARLLDRFAAVVVVAGTPDPPGRAVDTPDTVDTAVVAGFSRL